MEAVTSAIPSLDSARVVIGLVVIVLLVAGNLRGVRDAGAAFAAPTYLFVAAIALVVIAGLVKAGTHGFHPPPRPPTGPPRPRRVARCCARSPPGRRR